MSGDRIDYMWSKVLEPFESAGLTCFCKGLNLLGPSVDLACLIYLHPGWQVGVDHCVCVCVL